MQSKSKFSERIHHNTHTQRQRSGTERANMKCIRNSEKKDYINEDKKHAQYETGRSEEKTYEWQHRIMYLYAVEMREWIFASGGEWIVSLLI